MAKYVGTVRCSDIEGGIWTLVTDEGVVYQLDGGDANLRVDGAKVEIEGSIASDQFGFAMIGDILKVKSHQRLS